jgi:hypothetical protein
VLGAGITILGLVLGITSVTEASAVASMRAVTAPADSAVTALTVSPSTTAAGSSEVDYTVTFTATAALAQGQGTVTLSLPAGTAFGGQVNFNDISGPTGSVADGSGTTSNGGATLTVPVPIAIAARDYGCLEVARS